MTQEAFFAALASALEGRRPAPDLHGKRVHFVVYGLEDERWEVAANDSFHVGRAEAEDADLTLYTSPQELERMLASGESSGLRFVGDRTLLARMLAGGAAPTSPLATRFGGGS